MPNDVNDAPAPPRGAEARRDHRPARRRLVRRALGALSALALVALVVWAYLPKPVPVDLGEVVRAPFVVAVEEDGRTRVKDRFVVSAPVTGTLARLGLDPGDRIEAGQVLARIVPLASPLLDARARAEAQARVAQTLAAQRQSRASVARAEAALALATSEADRLAGLARSGAASEAALERAQLEARSAREELASARFGARVADHEVEMARAALGQVQGGRDAAGDADDQLLVRSPVDGVVLQVMRESEGVVQAGTPLLELGDPAALEIVVDVLTSDAVRIEPGDAVEIERWGGAETLPAHVRRLEPSAFTRTSALGVEEQRVNVLVDLDAPYEDWARLGDGYRVEARIRTWAEDDVLQVPASAVFRHRDGWAVYAARGGEARLVPVQVGHRNGTATQILEGLGVGDEVLLHPSDRVAEGVAIEPR